MPNFFDQWRSNRKRVARSDAGDRRSQDHRTLRRAVTGGILGLIWGLALYGAWLLTLYLVIQVEGGIARADESLILRVLHIALGSAILLYVLPAFGIFAALKWPSAKPYTTTPQVFPPGTKPVIILVHGTFASDDSDPGGAWWQTNGRLISTLEEEGPGNFDCMPFHWSGENLESARRKAATRLSAVINQLEIQQRPYHLVGHSHGGGVIWHALLRSSNQRSNLAHLTTWTTIGTPFMIYRSYLPTLWSLLPLYVFWRLNHEQPTSLFYILSTTNRIWPAILSLTNDLSYAALYSINTLIISFVIISGLIALSLLLSILGLITTHKNRVHEHRTYRKYKARHFVVSSSQDEAIQGLQSSVGRSIADIKVVPRFPYLNRSIAGKLFSPVTFPFIFAWNIMVTASANQWVIRVLRDRMHGSDLPRKEVQKVLYTPVDGAPSLSTDEEEGVRAISAEGATVAVGTFRSALGLFASGSPISLIRRSIAEMPIAGLVHNSYFLSNSVVKRICNNILCADDIAPGAANYEKATRDLSLRDAVTSKGLPQALLASTILLLLYTSSQVLFRTAVRPSMTSAHLESLLIDTAKASRLAGGEDARLFYVVLCLTRRCEGTRQLSTSIEWASDSFETNLELIRWQAACSGKDCDERDNLLDGVEGEVVFPLYADEYKWHSDQYVGNIAKLWQVATKLGGLHQVPDFFSDNARVVTSADKLNDLSADLEKLWLNVSVSSLIPPRLRAAILYTAPLFRLEMAESDIRAWDRGLDAEERLSNKLWLAEVALCKSEIVRRYQTKDEGELPAEKVERLMHSSEQWWGECKKHNSIAVLSLKLAAADYRALDGLEPANALLITRYWIALHNAMAESEARNESEVSSIRPDRKELKLLQNRVERDLLKLASQPDWASLISGLELIERSGSAQLSPRALSDLDEELRKRVAVNSKEWPQLMKVVSASWDLPKAKDIVLHELASQAAVASEWEAALYQFSGAVNVSELEKCGSGSGEYSTPCWRLGKLFTARSLTTAGRRAGPELLANTKRSRPMSTNGRCLNRAFRDYSQLKFALDKDIIIDHLTRRMGARYASTVYLQETRAAAAGGDFPRAFRSFASISDYGDRVLAGSEIALWYESFRRVLATDDLDAVTEWGNHDWQEIGRLMDQLDKKDPWCW